MQKVSHFEPIPVPEELLDFFEADGGTVRLQTDSGRHLYVTAVNHGRNDTLQVKIDASISAANETLQRRIDEHQALTK